MLENGNQYNVPKDQLSMKEVVGLVKIWYSFIYSKRRWLVIAGLVGGLAGLTYSMLVSPKYIATTSFILENTNKSALGDYSAIAAKFGLGGAASGGGLFQDDDNIMTLMKSRNMIAKTLYTPVEFEGRTTLLINRYIEAGDYRKNWGGNPRLSNLAFHEDPSKRDVLEDSVVSFFHKKILKEHLSVAKPDKDQDLIEISFVSEDELFSKAFNEQLLENVALFYIETQTKRLSENVTMLSQRVDSIRSAFNAALSGVATFSEANPSPNPAFQRLRVPSQRRMVDVEMNRAILEELVKNLELAKITLRRETPLVQVIDRPILPLEKKRVGKLKGILSGVLLFGGVSLLFFTIKLYVIRALQ